MKVCPILQGNNTHPQACLTDLCEWWQKGCPAYPKPPSDPAKTLREVAKKVKK